jgi:hypothetical protein
MNNNKITNIRKMLANESHAFSVPIDYENLIEKGLLKKVGKSYYVDNLNSLPEEIAKRIKTSSNGRHGIRVTFYKETKAMKNMAEKFKKFRD